MSPEPIPRRRLLVLATIPWLGLKASHALDMPATEPLLTIKGRVRNPNRGPDAVFDLPMLERLPQLTHRTKTPWHSGVRRFTGPFIRDVLRASAAQGQTLRMTALNDYRVDVPMDDVQRWDVIMARLLDDRPMSVRDKGPLFVMYPFDDHTELRTTLYFSRCAWQLRSIEVL